MITQFNILEPNGVLVAYKMRATKPIDIAHEKVEKYIVKIVHIMLLNIF